MLFIILFIMIPALTDCNHVSVPFGQRYVRQDSVGWQVKGIAWSRVVRSKLECARDCMAGIHTDDCVTVTYNRVTRLCQYSRDNISQAIYVNDMDLVTLGFEIDCGPTPDIENGTFVPVSVSEVGHNATLVCYAGFEIELSGNQDSTITCQHSGKWGNTINTCVSTAASFPYTYVTAFMSAGVNDANISIAITAIQPTLLKIETAFGTIYYEMPGLLSGFTFKPDSQFIVETTSDIIANKAVAVSSSHPVRVSMFYDAVKAAAASIVMEAGSLGTNYTIVSHSLNGEYMLVAITDGTVIDIVKNNAVVHSVTLDKFDAYMYTEANQAQPLTGVSMFGSDTFVVLAGHQCGNVPDENVVGRCEHFQEQIPPMESLETEYIISYMHGRPHFSIRAEAIHAFTQFLVYHPNGSVHHTINLAAGQTFFTSFTFLQTRSIVSTQPILLAQFGYSGEEWGDPSMMIISGVKQYDVEYYFTVPPNFDFNKLTITIKMIDDYAGLRLNYQPLTIIEDPISVTFGTPGVTFYVIYVNLTEGLYILDHIGGALPFGAVLYGSRWDAEYSLALGGLGNRPTVEV